MSGKHYKGPEVSCCIKYFIFGFNVIFWVSWSASGFQLFVADRFATIPPRVARRLDFSQPLGRVLKPGEAFALRPSSWRVGETFHPF